MELRQAKDQRLATMIERDDNGILHVDIPKKTQADRLGKYRDRNWIRGTNTQNFSSYIAFAIALVAIKFKWFIIDLK